MRNLLHCLHLVVTGLILLKLLAHCLAGFLADNAGPALSGHCAVVFNATSLLAFGGQQSDGSQNANMYQFDLLSNQWSTLPSNL